MINPVGNTMNLSVGNKMELTSDKNKEGASFSEMLKNSINNTNNMLKEADKTTEAFALGEIDDIHQVTIATEKARTSLNLTLAVQNKVMAAYKEVMRMQI
ncbi:MAG: flagellar hook-basal body complex protein FliE [bacterium]